MLENLVVARNLFDATLGAGADFRAEATLFSVRVGPHGAKLVERAGCEPAYACAGRFTVCPAALKLLNFSVPCTDIKRATKVDTPPPAP